MESTETQKFAWLDRPIIGDLVLNAEKILFIIIIVLAFVSRFYGLEWRVMSHDENTHVYYSWRFSQGQGLAHDPLMHGPFQFHLIALSYFMFGDNDFTARIPAAIFSIASVAFMWFYRRYLGRVGAIIGAVLMLISPYMLFYGRYVRNEVFSAFFGLVMLWSILRYLEAGRPRYLYYLSAITALHFTAKETAFIYQAQALIFLALYFIYRITKKPWRRPLMRSGFLLTLIFGLLLLAGFGMMILAGQDSAALSPSDTAAPSIPGQELQTLPTTSPPELQTILLILSLISFFLAAYFLIRGFTWDGVKKERSFGLLIILGTFVLPQLAAFPVQFIGWTIPTNASEVLQLTSIDIIRIAAFVIPLFLLSVVVGMMWNQRLWLINAAIFYAIFVLFYTSMFTNGAGFFTGLVGSLGYWLAQQDVNRGSQPWYYYAAVQIPVYEYIPAIGTLMAFVIGSVRWLRSSVQSVIRDEPNDLGEEIAEQENRLDENANFDRFEQIEEDKSVEKAPVLILFSYWAVTSLIAYSIAGEKMPWLTVHIAVAMILCASWAFGQLIEAIDWQLFRQNKSWALLLLVFIFIISLIAMIVSILGIERPFQGQSLEQLQWTSDFLVSLLVTITSGVLLFASSLRARLFNIRNLPSRQFILVFFCFFLVLLMVLNARTAYQAAYINYDNANELLVYAHSAGGVKQALSQIEEISRRTTNGLGIAVAYDNETSYPYWWYLRNYTNVRYFGADPTRSLREMTAILVGDANYGKIEAVVGNYFNRYDYIRLWWPNQDYFGLTWERIKNAIVDPQMRAAVFQIWLNRDYSEYGRILNRDMSLPNWSPAARMRLYIRKDVAAQLWDYGVVPAAEELASDDPFNEENRLDLVADRVIGESGILPGQFQNPRDIAIAPDGSIYIADTDNNRVQHLSPEGEVMHVWGSFGDATTGNAPGGTFNQPWGISVGPDGSVYVADTWNHRIQKFSPDGQFLTTWGFFGQAELPLAFWGPRGVAVDSANQVFITDTGNKRVVVFNENGEYITQFGRAGFAPGEFDEPVGIAVDPHGQVFIVDTWNQRIQVFSDSGSGNFLPLRNWDIFAWFGQSLDNKPYIAVDERGNVFTVEPEGYRILWFSDTGEALHHWGDFGAGLNQFGMPASVAIDQQGNAWVVDARNNRVMYFILPIDG